MESALEYISIEKSIINSLIEVKAMQAGLLPKKNWDDFLAELRAEEEQEKNNADNTDAEL